MTQFRMCKYCGKRIRKAWGRACIPLRGGDYCSRKCAVACHGFDLKLAGERRNGVSSFEVSKHDAVCANTKEPWEYLDESGARLDSALEKAAERIKKLEDSRSALDRAARIDPRLPGVLLLRADGHTQKAIAKRLRISQSTLCGILQSCNVTTD